MEPDTIDTSANIYAPMRVIIGLWVSR